MLDQSQYGILSCLVYNCKNNQEARLLLNILESISGFLQLDHIMGWQRSESSIAYLFEKAGGLDALEEVQRNSNYALYGAANEILTKFFEQEPDGTTSNQASGAP
jgi:Atypical Arm repeat